MKVLLTLLISAFLHHFTNGLGVPTHLCCKQMALSAAGGGGGGGGFLSRRTAITTAAGLLSSSLIVTTVPSEAESIEALSPSSAAPNPLPSPLQRGLKAAFKGGASGSAASFIQVLTLMWLRTCMNYEYANGGNFQKSLQALWEEGGIGRLYQGVGYALVQGPLTRFGDTAANVFALETISSYSATHPGFVLPLALKTLCGSAAAGIYRYVVVPIDTIKVTSQVGGEEGVKALLEDVKKDGIGRLYRGGVISAIVVIVGHYPWFLTFNSLDASIPAILKSEDLFGFLARSGFIGICSSCVSDTCSNALRVVKTIRQTQGVGDSRSPWEIAKDILDEEGIAGFTRGLKTRIGTNAIQGGIFSVLWKYFLAS